MGAYDRRITEGWIGVVINLEDESRADDAEKVLNYAGAVEIKKA